MEGAEYDGGAGMPGEVDMPGEVEGRIDGSVLLPRG